MRLFHKYPKIFAMGDTENDAIFKFIDDEIIIEEKLDGGNGRFKFDEETGEITFGTRNMVLDKNNPQTEKQYKDFIKYIKSKVKPEDLNPNYIYFGEIMLKHTLNYDWDSVPAFIGFDIMYAAENVTTDGEERVVFLTYDQKVKEFERLGLQVVNLQYRGPVKELQTKELLEFIQKSSYGDVQQEGIVIKNYNRTNRYDRQMFGKVVTDQFKEVNRLAFNSFKKAHDETDKLIATYCTPARIRKIVHKEINEYGQKLDKRLMATVPHKVIHDMFEENLVDILKSYKEISMQVIRKNVPRFCLKEIEKMMLENIQ